MRALLPFAFAIAACGGSDRSGSLFDNTPADQTPRAAAAPSATGGAPATAKNNARAPALAEADAGAAPDAAPPIVPDASPVDAAPPPPDAALPVRNFTCGIAQCNGATDYCILDGAGGGYQCVPYPSTCAGTPTCACLQEATGASQCNGLNGALTLTQL
jgi:hypothetical protein